MDMNRLARWSRRLPPGVKGIISALLSFCFVGLPLYNRGWSFLPCFGIQIGVMTALILIWIKIENKVKEE